MRIFGVAAAVFAFLVGFAAGCRPPAPVAYEPRLALQDLAPDLPAPEAAAHWLARDYRTLGRFPCRLAVAQLTCVYDGSDRRLALRDLCAADQARWTDVLRGVSGVSDVRFIRDLNLKADGEGLPGVLAAARRAEAEYLLVYTINRYGPNSAQGLGALYDAQTSQPVATFHTQALYQDEEGQEEAPEEHRGDRRDADAQYQAARALERQALAGLRDLIRRDQPRAETEPHRWKPLPPSSSPQR